MWTLKCGERLTERIFHTDSYKTEFDARVIHVEREEGRAVVQLDRTAFYPASGGQPFDTGILGAAKVIDVIENSDSSIMHVLEGELVAGQIVHGQVDWTRRFDHMQQHTGQHLLSAVFDRSCRAATVGFHLGGTASTIDLDRPVSNEEVAGVEEEANRIVWEDRPVSVRFVSDEEAAKLPLRKDPTRAGRLRLVEIEGADLSACGGTHVATTGAIGIIAVSSCERFKGGTRVEFLCGGRALERYRLLRDVTDAAVRTLSVLPAELPAAIERAQSENKDLRRVIKDLQERLADHEAAALSARATRVGGVALVVETLEGFDAQGMKHLASAIAGRPAHAVALLSARSPALVAVARSKDVAIDSASVLRVLMDRFGGRGGGRPDSAQGGGLNGSVSEMLETVRQTMIEALRTNSSQD